MLSQDEVIRLLDIYSDNNSTPKEKARARELLVNWLEQKRASKLKKINTSDNGELK
jgi:hypothetical protein